MEGTSEFDRWFGELTEEERAAVIRVVDLLEADGPNLEFPRSSDIRRSRHSNMRELRIQHAGRPYRVLYAFDPRRTGILLLGGDKTGDSRWYERNVPLADDLYDVYLRELEEEGIDLMAGRKKWSEIRSKAAPETLAVADALRESYRLRGLREARGLTQSEIAERLEVRQVSVSRMEARSDVRVSTLRAVVEAMGGTLEIRAVFPDAEYQIEVGEGLEVRPARRPSSGEDAREAA